MHSPVLIHAIYLDQPAGVYVGWEPVAGAVGAGASLGVSALALTWCVGWAAGKLWARCKVRSYTGMEDEREIGDDDL